MNVCSLTYNYSINTSLILCSGSIKSLSFEAVSIVSGETADGID